MPQTKCCVSSCSSSTNDGAILHNFPNPTTNPEKFRLWVTNAGLVDEDDDYLYRNRRICRLHFNEIYLYPKNRLSSLAVPSLHLTGETTTVRQMAIDQPQPSAIVDPLPSTIVDKHQPQTSTIVDPQPSTIEKPRPSANKKHQSNDRKCLQFKSYSKREIELHNTIAKTKAELKKCKKTKAELIKKLKITKKLTFSKAYLQITQDLSPAAKTFFKMQIREAVKSPKGRRFSLDEKILALSLYKPSPKAYRILSQICVLPKKSTLKKLMHKVFLLPGPNEVIFQHLKKRVNKMPSSYKYCTLLFDEMAISANLSYDKQTDSIKGLCDDGCQRTKRFADHALVFMVRGIFKKYKQPVAFSFCAGTTSTPNLKTQINIILKKVQETGLKVVATVCDQGATNMAAINSLINDTKAEYLRMGKEYKGQFFEIGGEEIYPIYDPPHLIKGMRNNLTTKNLEYTLDGKKRTAKWSHLIDLYKKGPGYKGVRLVPKLTAYHVMPHLTPKMKVKYATQVFSNTVSVAMGFTAGTGRIPKESKDTADLLMFFDKLFDSVNGSYSKPIKGKVYRSAVTPKSPHHKLWYKSLPVLKSMRFVGGRTGLVPSISSWIKTIEAFQQITKKLHSLGLRSLLLRNFNQDPLENFFGSIRAHGQSNIMPSSASFEASYKALLVNNMVSPKSIGANCETDDSYCLDSLKYFLTDDVPVTRPVNNIIIEIDMEDLSLNLPNIDDMLNSDAPADVEKCAAAAYCSGWIIKLIYKFISKGCDNCKIDLEGGAEATYSKFIELKKYSKHCMLRYPNKKLLEYFINIENITLEILKRKCEISQIGNYIELVATTLVSSNYINCERHRHKISKYVLKKSIVFFINDWCKEINNILCGKHTVWDKSDPMKELANVHYVKTKTKKRTRQSGIQINV